MNYQYLKSVLTNHVKSGFGIIEFSANRQGQVLNARIIKSSDKIFDELILKNLGEYIIPQLPDIDYSTNKNYRIPVYFKK